MLIRRSGIGLDARLIDFGLVKNLDSATHLSMSGMILGSPMYISPEQIKAQGVDDRTDIYALGLTLYFALTASSPYPDKGVNSLLNAQLHELPGLVSSIKRTLKEEYFLDWLIQTCIHKDPNERFQNVGQILQAIELHVANRDKDARICLHNGSLQWSNGSKISADNMPLVDGSAYVQDGSSLAAPRIESLLRSGTLDMEINSKPFHFSEESAEVVAESSAKTWPWKVAAVLGLVALLALFFQTFSLSSTPQPVAPVAVLPERVTITLSSVPDGADVYQDGNLVGMTPYQTILSDGEQRNVVLRLPGYQERELALSSLTLRPSVRLEPEEPPEPLSNTPQPAEPLDNVQPPPLLKTAPRKPPVVQPKSPKPVNSDEINMDKVRDPWAD